MRNFKFLKPLFTVGFIIFFAIITVANLLMFKYLGNWSTVYFIIVQELAVILAYMTAKGFTNSDHVPWKFARRWWPEILNP